VYLPLKHGQDRIQHRPSLSQNLVIPETKNRITMVVQPSCSAFISQGLGMLAAVDFDDQALLTAEKVGEERSEWHLPYELVAVEVTAP
jgi:hypothetical protein